MSKYSTQHFCLFLKTKVIPILKEVCFFPITFSSRNLNCNPESCMCFTSAWRNYLHWHRSLLYLNSSLNVFARLESWNILILNNTIPSVRNGDLVLSFIQKSGIWIVSARTNLSLQWKPWVWLFVVHSVVWEERLVTFWEGLYVILSVIAVDSVWWLWRSLPVLYFYMNPVSIIVAAQMGIFLFICPKF